ncbi:TPA: hypothetical protein DCR49_12295 [Candidatus Delongbacteria bacterium]|nr:hypothetical protein [Candidatus Delongbacteria bacterium]
MLFKKSHIEKAEGKTSEKRNFSIIVVLVFTICTAVIASVAIPAYISYERNSKEKIALNFAAMIAQSASAYYAQSEISPTCLYDVNVLAPSGYVASIGAEVAVVQGDGSPGYVSDTDFNTQTVAWR